MVIPSPPVLEELMIVTGGRHRAGLERQVRHLVRLASGGFDSAVAAWQLLKRGVVLDYVFCNLGGREHELETLTIAKRLADRWQVGTAGGEIALMNVTAPFRAGFLWLRTRPERS